jgi:hypothetical protein
VAEMHVGSLTADPPELGDLISRVANVEGDFRLETSGEALYREAHFPVVELARQLAQWASSATAPDSDFEYDSMFFEEPGTIWIRRSSDGWRIGSLEQRRPDLHELEWADVRGVIQRFVAEVVEAGRRDLGVDLEPVITVD